MAFLTILALWWCTPVVVCVGIALGAQLTWKLVAVTVVVVVVGTAAPVVDVFYFEPPDAQSALIVLPAPLFGFAAGVVFVVCARVVRSIARRH